MPISTPARHKRTQLVHMLSGEVPSGRKMLAQGMRDLEARKLALPCWADHEGGRLVFGAHATFTARNRWAHEVMALRDPAAPAAVRAFN